MPISFRRTPYLIQKEIIQQLSLQEAIFLSTTSKTSRALVKTSLHLHRFHIEYRVDRLVHSMVVVRKSGAYDFDRMFVRGVSTRFHWGTVMGPTLKFLDQNVELESRSDRFARVHVYSRHTTSFIMELYQYSMELFPRATINLSFCASGGAIITRILNLADVDEVYVDPNWRSDSDIIEAPLQASARTKRLRIRNFASLDVQLNPEIRFNLDYLYIESSDWIHREQLIQNFLNCKRVILPNTSFGLNELDYPEFVESWMNGSRMELLKIGGAHLHRWKITGTVGVLPGAVEVRRARVWEESEARVFESGCCYMVQQADGTRAIVSWSPDEVMLTTKFEISEGN